MTEKFNFENLFAFNSAEGRIFDPLAVESGDFPQLRSVFLQAMRCGKPVTARMLRFSPRSEIFELKVDETFWIRQVVDYSIKSKGHSWRWKSKGHFWLDLVIFKGKMIGIFGTHHQIRIPSLEEQIKEPWKARLHFINFQPMFEDQKIEVDLILRISPYLLWISFDFLFLEYQIHCFRIWNWL